MEFPTAAFTGFVQPGRLSVVDMSRPRPELPSGAPPVVPVKEPGLDGWTPPGRRDGGSKADAAPPEPARNPVLPPLRVDPVAAAMIQIAAAGSPFGARPA